MSKVKNGARTTLRQTVNEQKTIKGELLGETTVRELNESAMSQSVSVFCWVYANRRVR